MKVESCGAILVTGVRTPMQDGRPGNFGFHIVQRFVKLNWRVFVHSREPRYLKALESYLTVEEMSRVSMKFAGDLVDFKSAAMMARLVKTTLQKNNPAIVGLSGVVLTPGAFPKHPKQLIQDKEREVMYVSNIRTVDVTMDALCRNECLGPHPVVVTCSSVTATASVAVKEHDTGRQCYLLAKRRVEEFTEALDLDLCESGGRAFTLAFGVLENTPREWWPEGFDPHFVVPMEDAARQVEQLVHFRQWPEESRVVVDGGWTVQPGQGFWA